MRDAPSLTRPLRLAAVTAGLLGALLLGCGWHDGGGEPPPERRTPAQVLRAYLEAVKAEDPAAAKRLWHVEGPDAPRALDVIVGRPITARRLNRALQSKFAGPDLKLLEGWIDESVNDEAIDRTLRRLKDAEVIVRGDRATLRIPWEENDGSADQPAFLYFGSRPVAGFRRVGGAWKLDGNREIGFQRPADLWQPWAWFYFDPTSIAAVERVVAGIEGGRLRTAEQAKGELEAGEITPEAELAAYEKDRPADPVETRFFAAWKISLRFTREFYAGRGSLWGLYHWSRRLMDAEQARAADAAERRGAAEAHRVRLDEAAYEIRQRAADRRVDELLYFAADVYRADAEIAAEATARPDDGRGETLAARTARLAAAVMAHASCEQDIERIHQEVTPPSRTRRLRVWDGAYWSAWVLASQLDEAANPAARLAAAAAYQERAVRLAEIANAEVKAEHLDRATALEAEYGREHAAFLVQETKASGEKGPALADAARRWAEAARAGYEEVWARFPEGRVLTNSVYEWSCRWRDAAAWAARTRAERVAAAEAHLARMEKLRVPVRAWYRDGKCPAYEWWATDYYLAEAKVLVEKAKAP
jgi:hypothetical protein